ncbi:MAG: hypothetical protein GWN73_17310, partial [Actinobacteria bacterium]|nr:hypothetical protein [Actinomycetota bacterium]NIS32014.1 hypothetical protein [Actinomycetota bacterium]NIU67086.1 hypothetical protein [Actinomycetota bacterium]
LPTATTDENGNVLTRVYDGFGRLHQVFAPGDPDAEPTIVMTYAQGADPPYAVTDHKDVTRPGDPIATA